MSKTNFTGWLLDPADRAALLDRVPPRYERVVADHVTLAFNPAKPKVPRETTAEVVGATDDDEGVQALVVRIGGTTDRPDGSTYHMTWSLGPGRDAKESNDVLRTHGWTRFEEPIRIRLHPKLY
jgi:hypothetical protein